MDLQTAYRIDASFQSSINQLQVIKPRNTRDVGNYLNQRCSFKLPMKQEAIEALSLKSSKWKEFMEECIGIDNDDDCCFLELLFELLQREYCPSTFASETEMATALNYSFRLIEFIVNGGNCNRNVSSTLSGNKRPGYFTSSTKFPLFKEKTSC